MPEGKPHDLRHIVILANPNLGSFSHAMAEAYCAAVADCGQTAVIRDLYALRFNPLLQASELPPSPSPPAADVAAELDVLRDAAVIVFVYPLWFGMPPAIIKGYVDRVLGAGFSGRDMLAGTRPSVIQGKRLISFSTSASTRPWIEERGQWIALRQGIDSYLAAVFGLIDAGHSHFDAIVAPLSERYARECLLEVGEQARQVSATILSERHARQLLAYRQRARS
ncbi:NAD(P)H-dependent oxidoreductase [Sphingomonas qilianensis]|uniref:NAD(P)H-dependent oxidoreductase n=1 Tax=Sphingomonas qilianensis TaxID=1736690 RepID=A0ABU9XRA2_9SPHN